MKTSAASSDAGNVRVCCRVRPQNNKELQMASAKRSVFVNDNVLEVKTGDGPPQKFTYDHVFGEDDDQRAVFECVARPVVQDIMAGYNATIFAYGQTSSGKTYTMEGASIDDPSLQGIIPRTATAIFENVLAADTNLEFIVKVSYIEIYMERIRDLLDPFKQKTNLHVREDATRGIFVEHMTEVCVTSDYELLTTMRDGAMNRAVAATGMNEGSSRSHSVFMVTLVQRHVATQATKSGTLYLVDLAGSEMVRKTGASGRQLDEAKTINKSLSALGMVINALTDAHATHIPYRDSKLTRVLQESLGGNARTALIINVSPSSYNTSETLSTLRFGNRAKSIQNKAVVNEQRSVDEYKLLLTKAEKTLAIQQRYIATLEAQLQLPSGDKASGLPDATSSDDVITTPADVALDLSLNTTTNDAVDALHQRIAQLEDALADEKRETSRQHDAICSLQAKVQDQAHALATSKTVIDEVQTVKELVEKARDEQVRQCDVRYAELQTEFERLRFEHDELRIHAETLQREYETLVVQDVPLPAAVSPEKIAAAIQATDAATAAAATKELPEATPAERNDKTNESTATTAHEEGAGNAQPAAATTDVSATTTSGSTAAASNDAVDTIADTTDDAASDSDDTTPPLSAAGESSMEPLDAKTKCVALESELRAYEREYRQLQAATEREKSRLLDDVERKHQQIRELELELDRAAAAAAAANTAPTNGAPSPVGSATSSSGMSARERQHMRSIQQKLEQLVAVHRQLLRKYASLELELSEAKKKLVLRDERIKQVESNNRLMAGNMRAQAEKHVDELTHLRDQIADFRGAQRSHFEAQLLKHAVDINTPATTTTNATAGGGIKTVRGGSSFYSDGVIRPIRGGGRRSTVMTGPAGVAGASGSATGGLSSNGTGDSASGASTGFLTRLFGKGS